MCCHLTWDNSHQPACYCKFGSTHRTEVYSNNPTAILGTGRCGCAFAFNKLLFWSLLKWCHFISRLHPLSQNYLYWRSHAGMLQIKYNVLFVQYVNNNYAKSSFRNNEKSSLFLAGLPRARSARGTEPHTHGIWSTSFRLVVTWLTERTYVRTRLQIVRVG